MGRKGFVLLQSEPSCSMPCRLEFDLATAINAMIDGFSIYYSNPVLFPVVIITDITEIEHPSIFHDEKNYRNMWLAITNGYIHKT